MPEFEIQESHKIIKPDKKNNLQVDFTVKSNIKISKELMWTHIWPSGFNQFYIDTIVHVVKNQILNFSKIDPKLSKAWQEGKKSLAFSPNDLNKNTHSLRLEFPYKKDNKFFGHHARTIQYDHIPSINYFKIPSFHILSNDIKIVNRKIGYIIGAGDKVPEALDQIGYDVTLLTNKELSRNNLQQFDAIITGVRAYNTNEWLNNHHYKLMKYVENGGNLIVQYNTSNNIGPVRAKIGPYNFNISRTRITDENAPVVFLNPEHPVLNFPNKIGQEDFKGWIQERTIYHASAFDSAFQTVIAMNDPNEKADNGSLIIAKHGKGYFTYTGIVFFRQLPAGVPGAYRLLANLIALNSKKPDGTKAK